MRDGVQTGSDLRSAAGAPFGASQHKFLQFLETLPAAAYLCDPEGLITYFNEHAARLWGREPRLNDPSDRYCGSFRLYAMDGTPILHEACWMALALGQGREFIGQEILVERPDGARVAVLAHANPLRDESGTLVGAVNVLIEVGARHESDMMRAHLASIVQTSDDAIISKHLDGRIVSWNSGAERLFGYSADEAIGQPITLIVPPDLWEEERRLLASLARGERVDHLETERIAKSGQRIHVSISTSPLRDPTGRIIGASKIARDITARKQSELAIEALSEQRAVQLSDLTRLQEMGTRLWTTQELSPMLEETLRTALAIEGTDSGTISIGSGGGDRVVLGASIGIEPAFLATLEEVSSGSGPIGRCLAEGRRIFIEDLEAGEPLSPYRRAALAAGVRAVHCTPLITRAGEAVGVLATNFRRPHRPSERQQDLIDLCVNQAVDFIENAQLQARLREDDERKNEFLAILAHELRNPLAPIRNALELMRRDPTDAETLERTQAIMERQVGHMVRLVDDLMDVSRITHKRLVLKKEPTLLAAVLESAVDSARPAMDAAGHQFTISLPEQPVTLNADPTRLAQVFSNLLGNAAKYTPDGGRIWLEAERRGDDRVVVKVRDDGLGIAPGALSRIFEIFTQAADGSEHSQDGLGIGLTLVRGLVELHGGSITARSDGVGQGSEFEVELSISTGVEPTAATPQPDAKPAGAAKMSKILIVDDNEDAAISFSLLVQRMGHETKMAVDGIEALQVASDFRPDIAFLDIGLPKLNGYEVARAIRSQAWGAAVHLVALTGWGQDRDKRLAIEAGFDMHLVKPIDPASLGELIKGFQNKPR